MEIILGLILIIGLALCIFWICRAIILWYFKIDTIAENIQEQTKILKRIENKLK